jgi:single-strand DNA-binding protein
MGSLNAVTLIGRLGADPELKYTQSNMAVCNLNVATDNLAGKGKEKTTEWHRVTVWGEAAENAAKFLKKGREVAITGRLQTRSYEKNGEKRYATDVVADRVVFLGKGDGQREETAPATGDEGGIPF